MKKTIVVTEAQLRMLQEQEWQMSSTDNGKLVEKAQKDLSMFNKSFDSHYNMIGTLSISEILGDIQHYNDTLENMDTIIDSIEGKFNYYYEIVESHDIFDRPKEIAVLDKVVNDIQDTFEELKTIRYVLDEMIGLSKKISEMKPKNVININEGKGK